MPPAPATQVEDDHKETIIQQKFVVVEVTHNCFIQDQRGVERECDVSVKVEKVKQT